MMSFNAPGEREKSLWLVRRRATRIILSGTLTVLRRWRLRVMIWRVSLVW